MKAGFAIWDEAILMAYTESSVGNVDTKYLGSTAKQ
jgi:hypothetical protein